MKKQIIPGIIVEPRVRFGKPIIQGTRVPVDLVVGKVASGMNLKEVMKEYDLTKTQVLAALKYAADIVSSEEVAYT